MADSTITLRVVGDTSRAGGAPAGAPQAPGKGPANAPQAPGAASDAGAAAPGLAPALPGAGPANGGKSIAGQIGAFAAGWGGQQVLGAVTGMINAVPGRQREASWVGNIGGGLLGGAAAGAALGGTVGSVVGGPIGTAAEACRLSYSRVQRELKAGFAGILLRGKVHRRAKRANADKGRRSVATTSFANRLVGDFLKQGLSVATCLYTLRHEGWTRLPSQRTAYCHLKDGVIVLPKGRLRYRPRKTRRRGHPSAARSSQTAGASRNARQKSSPVNVLSTGRKVPSSTSMASSAFVSQRYQLLKGLPSGNHPRPEPAQRHLPEPTP